MISEQDSNDIVLLLYDIKEHVKTIEKVLSKYQR